jgi:hypothetical protein
MHRATSIIFAYITGNNRERKDTIMIRNIILGAALLILILPFAGAAQTQPVNIALVNPIQIFPENNSISGIRINFIYGKNISMAGIDLGLANHVGTGGFTGFQWGMANLCDGDVVGMQVGLLNLDKKNVEGFQWGWYNSGDYVNGFQLGLVNSAERMKGIQIGIINLIKGAGSSRCFL